MGYDNNINVWELSGYNSEDDYNEQLSCGNIDYNKYLLVQKEDNNKDIKE